jgi:hypothetical protein
MVSHLKTTIDIPDHLLEQAKRLAAEQGVALKAVVEMALRETLRVRKPRQRRFRLRECAVGGDGLQPGLTWGDWHSMRTLAYEGRGG